MVRVNRNNGGSFYNVSERETEVKGQQIVGRGQLRRSHKEYSLYLHGERLPQPNGRSDIQYPCRGEETPQSEKIGVAQSEILRVPPGITGPWQVAGRNRTSFKERIEVDAYYVRNWSVWLDFIILARTMRGLNPGRGAY